MTDDYGFGTRCVHAGQEEPDPATGARAPPIYQTSSYVFEDADTAADRYALEDDGNVYSRFDNPTVRMLENRIASLENAVDAVATGSGMAALDAGTFVLAANGDNIVTASSIYGGTHSYFSKAASRRGIETRFVDTLDPDAYAAAIDEDTAYVHFETIGNPSLVVPPMEDIAEVAHDHGVPVFVDNTFGTPALCNPLDHGVDLLWESTTKWIHGSGTTVGGVLVDGGSFPWDEYPEKFPELGGENKAFEELHRGIRRPRLLRRRPPARPPVAGRRPETVRRLGDASGGRDALPADGAPLRERDDRRTAPRRPPRCRLGHLSRTGESRDPRPGTAVPLRRVRRHRHLRTGGGYDAGRRFCEETELAQFLANIGDAKTLVIHPASTTHAQLSEEEQRASGVTPDLLRFSVGIEDPEDIIADIDEAIERVT